MIYGKQTYSLAEELRVSPDEAQEMVDRYFKYKPAVRDFINNTQEFLKENGFVDTLQGHRRQLNGIFGGYKEQAEAERQSVNTVK